MTIRCVSDRNDIEQLRSLWEMKLEWEGLWDGYKLGKFKDLQTDAMEETAGRFMKKVRPCLKPGLDSHA